MRVITSSSGKIGTCVEGPISFLNEEIEIGECAVCVAQDPALNNNLVWIVGGAAQIFDVIGLAIAEGILDNSLITLFEKIETVMRDFDTCPMQRLARAIGCGMEDLKECVALAQVYITNPIGGITEYSSGAATKVKRY